MINEDEDKLFTERVIQIVDNLERFIELKVAAINSDDVYESVIFNNYKDEFIKYILDLRN